MTQDPTKSPAVSERDTQAFRLMQDFYCSQHYDPDPKRPADQIENAIAYVLAPAPKIVVTEDQRERALAAGRAIVHGQGDGTYDEATDAIHLLLAALGGSQPAPEKVVREALEPFARWIVPDQGTLSGWRFGVQPSHDDYKRAYHVLAALAQPEAARHPGMDLQLSDEARAQIEKIARGGSPEAIRQVQSMRIGSAQPEDARVGGLREALAIRLFERSSRGGRWENVSERDERGDMDWDSRAYWRDLADAALARQPAAGSEG